ncbi:MAG: heavy-metal-associated domain-containing protein [Myxococcales bacterium]|nr:heavy-metal-associated domain-containing protein [Myxococcales bacterium]
MRARLLALRLALAPAGLAGLACAPAAEAPLATLELEIGGMVCDSCARAITAAVEQLEGVRSCRVTLGEATPGHGGVAGRAVVEHDARVDAAAISAAISRIGYTASPL